MIDITYDVFISYSRKDSQIADEICHIFARNGISYWNDRGGITSGQAFHSEIVQAIKKSKITVFVSSANSNVSKFTIKEIVIAFNNEKHIIPFCIDKAPFADSIELYLCDLDRISYHLDKESSLQKLVDDVSRLLHKERHEKAKKEQIQREKAEIERLIEEDKRLQKEKEREEIANTEQIQQEKEESKRQIEAMKIFIGSSKEATAFNGLLNKVAIIIEQCGIMPIKWNDIPSFKASTYTLENLVELTEKVNAAMFIWHEDDLTWYRGKEVGRPMDNIIL